MLVRLIAAGVLFAGCKACVSLSPLGYPCDPGAATQENECLAGSRCGLEGHCHALDAGAAYLCHTSADCEGPWRCGLEDTCHPFDAGADYLCSSDTDCEAQWRCGPLGRCVDARADALELPDAGFTALGVRPLFGPTPGPTDVAGASDTRQLNGANAAGCNYDLQVHSTSWVTAGTLHKHVNFPSGALPLDDTLPQGAECDSRENQQSFGGRYALEWSAAAADVIDLADQGAATFTLSSSGMLCQHAFDPQRLVPLPSQCMTPFTGGAPTRLRATELDPGLVAWNSTQIWYLPAFGGPASGPFTARESDGSVAQLNDVMLAPFSRFFNDFRGLFAMSDGGLHAATIDDAGVLTSPAGANTFSLQQTYASTRDGPDHQLYIKDGYVWFSAGQFAYVLDNPADTSGLFVSDAGLNMGLLHDAVLGTCEADDGSKLTTQLTASPAETGDSISLLSRCKAVVPGHLQGHQAVTLSSVGREQAVNQLTLTNDKDIDSSPPALFFSANLRAYPGNAAETVWADDQGHLWSMADQSGTTSLRLIPQFPDVPLDFVGGSSSALVAGTLTQSWLALSFAGFDDGFIAPMTWHLALDGGFDEGPASGFLAASGAVRGLNRSEVLVLPQAFFGRSVGVSNGDFEHFIAAGDDPAMTLSPLDISAVSRGGQPYLVWRAFDTVWLAEVDLSVDAGIFDLTPLPSPERRLTPLPGQAVTSMALDDERDGGFVSGYLVAGPRLFSVSAPNPRVWRTDEVVVGTDEPVEVFFDRGRARVALRDGSLWSLPSRVMLAPSFDASVGLALGFGTVCQNVVALAQGGLYRLEWTADQPLGQWQSVALPPEVMSVAPGGTFAKSRLISIDKDVLLVHGNGVTYRLSWEGCE